MEIERNIMDELVAWKKSPHRKPLVMQGARQVGKSWVMKRFGERYYDNMLYLNFDTMPGLKDVFVQTKEPAKIIRALSLITGREIVPDSTLIVFDEIQECNEALNSLKYFCEDAPEFHIVCAGSLMGVALNRQGASFPVGKVDFTSLHPATFSEYLRSASPQLYQTYERIDGIMNVPEVIHQQLIDAYKIYLLLGGMPEVVSVFCDDHNFDEVAKIQSGILQSYTLDFAKHIDNKDIPRVFQVWNNLQDQLARENKKFRFADIKKGARAREYETAIEWLCLAGLVNRVNAVETPRLPLSAYKKGGAFKLYLNDVGLLCRKLNLDYRSILQGNRLLTEFKGVLTENYVLMSLVQQFGKEQYYWTSGNTAEVEFVLQYMDKIIPIEVKAEHNVKAKSLSIYRKTYNPDISIRLSTLNMRKDADLINIPLYLVDKIKEILNQV